MKMLSEVENLSRRWVAIESIQSALSSAGARFFTREQIENMKVGELLNMATPNCINIKAEYDSETYVKLQRE